jgi:hypothetical protein
MEDPAAFMEHPAALMEDPAAFMEDPAAFMEDPAAFMEDPAAFMEDPAAFMEDPAAFMEDPAAFMEDPAAFMEDPARNGAVPRAEWGDEFGAEFRLFVPSRVQFRPARGRDGAEGRILPVGCESSRVARDDREIRRVNCLRCHSATGPARVNRLSLTLTKCRNGR